MANEVAVFKKDFIDSISGKLYGFIANGELRMPGDYSPENALKAAWLKLQSIVDRDKKSVLQSCTKESIANSLMDMVVQGLHPGKDQGYFIAYGNQLVFQRSYHGTMAVTRRVDDSVADIVAEVVYEGDTFTYKINLGRKEIVAHEQSLDNVGKNIRAAYCLILDTDGNVKSTTIMTFDEIKQSWKMSKTRPVENDGKIKKDSTHYNFMAEMCKRTVINRACKPIINSSSDSHLFRTAVERSSMIRADMELAQEVEENANVETIDITPEPAQEPLQNTQQLPPQEAPLQDVAPPPEAELTPTGTDGPGF